MNDLFCGKFVPRRENQMQRPAEKDEPTGSPRFVLILNFLISSRPLSTASKRPALPSTTNVLLSYLPAASSILVSGSSTVEGGGPEGRGEGLRASAIKFSLSSQIHSFFR